jgi:hypothetical protein
MKQLHVIDTRQWNWLCQHMATRLETETSRLMRIAVPMGWFTGKNGKVAPVMSVGYGCTFDAFCVEVIVVLWEILPEGWKPIRWIYVGYVKETVIHGEASHGV